MNAQARLSPKRPAVWFPAIRTGTGSDAFTIALCNGLNQLGVRAEVSWLPHRAEYLPWSSPRQTAPAWANVVHTNSWLPTRFWRDHPGTRLVTTVHHSVHDDDATRDKGPARTLYHRWWVKPTEARALALADAVIAVSQYTADAIRRSFPSRRMEVIHNGVDTDRYVPTGAHAPSRPFKVLYVGSWSTRKGSDLLAPVMHALGPGFELRHTGTAETAAQWGLTDTVALGRIDQSMLISEMQHADVLLLPTRLEGFGLVAAEAMACGTPVVASRCSSLPEIITDHENGLLCPLNDVGTFVTNIRALAADPALRERLARSARSTIVERFTSDRFIRAHIDLYARILAEPA